MTTFQVDVSRTYQNKAGYQVGGYKLNNSFTTETHTPKSFLDSIVKEGWPYTMVHQKRSPQETGAIKRNPNLTTPKHLENFVSRQELTADDDSQATGVIDFWLNDPWFKANGFAFVESVNSQPGEEKGHPTIIFDRPITCPQIYKEAMKAIKYRYPRLDPLNNIDRTIYNAEGAAVHLVGNICAWDVFEQDILSPYREHIAKLEQRKEAERAKRRREYEQARASGRLVTDGIEKYLQATIDGILDWLATRTESRHKALFSAGAMIGRLLAADWTTPYLHLLSVDDSIVQATRLNGYFEAYARTESEVLRTLYDGLNWGKLGPAPSPELYRTEQGKIQDAGDFETPNRFQLKPFELSPEAKERQASILASQPPRLARLAFEAPLTEADHEKCPKAVERHIWTSEGGKGKTPWYCNDSKTCAFCRERQATKLRYYLEEICRAAYVDKNGDAAYAKPTENEAGDFASLSPGPGFWYAKVLAYGNERRNFVARYRRARPGGFVRPEIYPILDNGNNFYIALSLAPFGDMKPLKLTDDLLQRIAMGTTGTKASLLFAPPRKHLERALPRYTFEIPSYLHERGIIATVKAAHTVLFTGPVSDDDIYSDFGTKAKSFDEIGMIFEELALRAIDTERLRGVGDHAPDYVIQSIHIVPKAKQAYLRVYNAGREGDEATIEKYKRKNLPKLKSLFQKRVDKAIVFKDYMRLSTRDEPEPEPPTDYYARIEQMLRVDG